MNSDTIKDVLKCGETSTVQFKRLFRTADDIANELAAFSNSQGGCIIIGIDDKSGAVQGLDYDQLQTLGSLIASAANSCVHPAVFPQVETLIIDGKPVMTVSIEKGTCPPYVNNKGEIYVKQGPDKRRVTERNEILRLFEQSGSFQPDRQIVQGTSLKDLDPFLIEKFFERTLGCSTKDLDVSVIKLFKIYLS